MPRTTAPEPASSAEAGSGAALASEFERFLAGESNGDALLCALYGGIADEPTPRRLLAIVRGAGKVEGGRATILPFLRRRPAGLTAPASP